MITEDIERIKYLENLSLKHAVKANVGLPTSDESLGENTGDSSNWWPEKIKQESAEFRNMSPRDFCLTHLINWAALSQDGAIIKDGEA